MATGNDRATVEALHELLAATVSLTHQLTAAAQQLHGGGEATAARRGVLLSLRFRGPLTVPQLARMRPVSRQHIQVLVNALLEDGLVETLDNPAHRRSRLVRITTRGERLLAQMRAREDRLFRRLPLPGGERELRAASKVLAGLRATLAGSPLARLSANPPSRTRPVSPGKKRS